MIVGLKYEGKKPVPRIFKMLYRGREYELNFRSSSTIINIEKEVADFILKFNPTGFVREVPASIEGEELKHQSLAEPDEEEDKNTENTEKQCPICGKVYAGNMPYWYDRHVKKCKKTAKTKTYTVDIIGAETNVIEKDDIDNNVYNDIDSDNDNDKTT